jgi:hypothetical protein
MLYLFKEARRRALAGAEVPGTVMILLLREHGVKGGSQCPWLVNSCHGRDRRGAIHR